MLGTAPMRFVRVRTYGSFWAPDRSSARVRHGTRTAVSGVRGRPGGAHRVSTVLGRKGIFLVDLTCESCAHEWSIELQALLARVEHLPPITDDSPRPRARGDVRNHTPATDEAR